MAIEADILIHFDNLPPGSNNQNPDAARNFQRLPVYLAIFALAQYVSFTRAPDRPCPESFHSVFQFILAIDAVIFRNTLQFVFLVYVALSGLRYSNHVAESSTPSFWYIPPSKYPKFGASFRQTKRVFSRKFPLPFSPTSFQSLLAFRKSPTLDLAGRSIRNLVGSFTSYLVQIGASRRCMPSTRSWSVCSSSMFSSGWDSPSRFVARLFTFGNHLNFSSSSVWC